MKDIQYFDYQDTSIRAVLDGEEILFVAADVANLLGYRMASDLVRSLDDDEKGTRPMRTPSGEQRVLVITEPGLNKAIIQRQTSRMTNDSMRAKVKEIQRWVTHEVLPAIRKTGGYGQVAPVPTGPELVALALVEANKMLEVKDEKIAVLEPKADAYEAFMNADGTYSLGRVAKMLGRSQNKLFAELRNAGVLIAKGHMHNTPYQRYMHHFKVSPYSYERRDGSIGCSYTTTVQPSGVEFIRRKLGIPHVQHELEVA